MKAALAINKAGPLSEDPDKHDVIILGAGLSGLSVAYQLAIKQPHLKVLVLDQCLRLDSSKTWSFHRQDIEGIDAWLPLIDYRWPSYQVFFSYRRQFNSEYCSIASGNFFKKVSNILGNRLLLNTKVNEISNHQVKLANGQTLTAPIILDARGTDKTQLLSTRDNEDRTQNANWGFQKFFGLELKVAGKHHLTQPILMDARVDQLDGYRFFYTLPLTDEILLIEDTRYSNCPDLNEKEYRQEILAYAQKNGWSIESEIRSEIGILPIPTSSPLTCHDESVIKIGSEAGLYHPVTGYSFLWCARLADRLAQISEPTQLSYQKVLLQTVGDYQRTQSFYLLLNRLMFQGANDSQRLGIFDRFYKLPEKTIERFYSSKTNWADRLRILVGKPPIPVMSALRVMRP